MHCGETGVDQLLTESEPSSDKSCNQAQVQLERFVRGETNFSHNSGIIHTVVYLYSNTWMH